MEGDLELVLKFNRKKPMAKWQEPSQIKKISDTNYLLNLPGKVERNQIYHVNMLKREINGIYESE